ncbi:MAG: response regulator transcription factor [Planctomycetes bacterium]|nr:response regulator transcription factor [Planctomycetota bacterium]
MRILIVEDDDKIAAFLARGFEEEGFAVDLRSDGAEGLRAALSGDHDLIVLDLLIPKVDGIEVLRRYRAGGGEAPVLVLTARDELDTKVEGLDAGADDYLTKPFAFEELLARARALQRRRGPSRVPALRFADLRLDLATRRASRSQRSIELSPREFSLLEFFLRNPGTVLSRTRLFERVWAGRYDGLTNVVDVYVNYLRRKLERDGECRLIQTVRGHGYVLREES